MRRHRYAVIDVNTLPDFLIFAATVAKWMGARLVLDMHEITPEFYMSKYRIGEDSMFVHFLKYLERISFDFADHVVTINEPIQDLLIHRGLPRAKSTVVMNAVDEAGFSPGASATADAAAAPGRFVMMYHGTLTRIYGLDFAIDAFARAHANMPGAELWILGAGPERDALAGQAQRLGVASRVKLLGQVPSSEIPAWLKQCDVGVLPMRSDVFLEFAFPNKLPEFVIAGKTVLIARLKAIRHYFSDKALAYFEPNDAGDLARQMVRLFRDRDLGRRQAARAAQEYAPIRWELMKRRYLDLIENLAPSGHRTPLPSRAADTTVLAP
jgi:glycosyltransferase involved in cell wall biosynthesis